MTFNFFGWKSKLGQHAIRSDPTSQMGLEWLVKHACLVSWPNPSRACAKLGPRARAKLGPRARNLGPTWCNYHVGLDVYCSQAVPSLFTNRDRADPTHLLSLVKFLFILVKVIFTRLKLINFIFFFCFFFRKMNLCVLDEINETKISFNNKTKVDFLPRFHLEK